MLTVFPLISLLIGIIGRASACSTPDLSGIYYYGANENAYPQRQVVTATLNSDCSVSLSVDMSDWKDHAGRDRPTASGTFSGNSGSVTFPDDRTYPFTWNAATQRMMFSSSNFWTRKCADLAGTYYYGSNPYSYSQRQRVTTTLKRDCTASLNVDMSDWKDWYGRDRPPASGTLSGNSGSLTFPDDRTYSFTWNAGTQRMMFSSSNFWTRIGGGGSSAHALPIQVLDVFNGDNKNKNYYGLLVWIIGALVVVNLVCVCIYLCRKNKSSSQRYKVVSMDTDTDV